MKSTPPTRTHARRRELRAWKVTADGPFWGAVLLMAILGSAVTFVIYTPH